MELALAFFVGVVIGALFIFANVARVEKASARVGAKHDLEKFKARLRGLAVDDPLWPMLLALVDEHVRDAVEACVLPGLPGDEAHRLRGRVGMMLDFRDSLSAVWEETHKKETT